MRVVSWNLLQGGGVRVDGIIEQLRQWNPDVVGLSEFRGTAPSQQIATALSDSGLVHQALTVDSAARSQNGLLLASRFPFRQHTADGPLAELGRWLHVEIVEPFPLQVILMHLPNRGEGPQGECHREVVEFFQRHAASAAIAMGDTNTGVAGIDEEAKFFNRRESDWFQQITQTTWLDVWRHRNPTLRQYTYRTAAGTGFRIDQLFATASIEPRISQIQHDWCDQGPIPTKLSDHAAIIADIETS